MLVRAVLSKFDCCVSARGLVFCLIVTLVRSVLSCLNVTLVHAVLSFV